MAAKNLGVFLPNWIGDVVMATPMLRSLREHAAPNTRIVGVMRPYVRDVLAGSPWLDDVLLYDPHSDDKSLHSRPLVRALKAYDFETTILATNSLRTAIVAFAARIPNRVGYVRYGRSPFLTRRLYAPRSGRRYTPISAVDYYAELANAIGAKVSDKTLHLTTTSAGEARADVFWQRHKLGGDAPVVGLSPGAAYGAAKEWPVEYYAALARQLATQDGVRPLILCGPSERDAARTIVQLSANPLVRTIADETLSIELSKSVIKRCDAVVSNDSGPRHIAAAFDVPTVTIFGPTDPRWSDNFHAKSIDLQRNLPCGPCAQRSCPLLHHQCMRDMTVEQVHGATRQLLRNAGAKADTRVA